jgi:hypothetical protein
MEQTLRVLDMPPTCMAIYGWAELRLITMSRLVHGEWKEHLL